MKVEFYKIYNPDTKLFSKGGLTPDWSKKGKTWSSNGSIRSHLGQFVHSQWIREERGYGNYQINIPKNWVVVKIYSEDGIVKQEEINAVDFYLQSKDTNYAKYMKRKQK